VLKKRFNEPLEILMKGILYMSILKKIGFDCFLYEYETWSFTLREESRLSVSENRVLRRIFGPKRHAVTEKWRKLHKKKFNDE
jgi:hypothetical protein